MMKRVTYIVMVLLTLAGCGKLGKDGRVKKNVDWTQWYYDDEGTSKLAKGVMIMSFNVRLASAADDTGDKDWSNRRKGCYAMVNTLRPVLMGTQECQLTQKNDLKNNCPGYEVIGRSRDTSSGGEEMAIFYLKDSVSVDSWTTFWLTDTPDKVSKHPQAEHYRCATCAKFTHKKTGKKFYYIDTHLDLESVRGYEMAVIHKYISDNLDTTLPIIMSADWNDTEDSDIFTETYQTFQNARWAARSGDAYGTFNGFKNTNSSTKIDHIFYRGFSGCAKFVTVRQQWEGYQFISDHYPVYAYLEF